MLGSCGWSPDHQNEDQDHRAEIKIKILFSVLLKLTLSADLELTITTPFTRSPGWKVLEAFSILISKVTDISNCVRCVMCIVFSYLYDKPHCIKLKLPLMIMPVER